jgi:Flp pilus assembly protein TadG
LGNRGIALAQTGIALTALISLVAVGVDVGRIALTATEVQTLADLSAAAGAKEIVDPHAGGTARAGADAVIPLNTVDGAAAAAGDGGEVPNVDVGNYDFDNATFTNGGTPNNAVRATATVQVNTLLAGIFGSSTETVTKTATAAFGSTGGAQPQLPLTVCDSNFPNPDCMGDGCLPNLIQVPNPSDTSGWTGFFETAGTSTIGDFFPTACGGEGNEIPYLNVGDEISVNNGQETPLLNLLQACLDAGLNTFVIPIIDCPANINQDIPVMGFATIVVTAVYAQGSPKYVELGAIFNASLPGPPGGGNFGSGSVTLVN